jgi:PPM family protein phosphatase
MTSGIPIQTIDLGVISDQGRTRPRNEDAYGYEQLLDVQGQPIGWIFVVADGVGGEYHGDIASKMAVHRVIDVYKSLSLQYPLVPPPDILRDAIHLANSEVYNRAVELNVAGHMGTTVVAAVLRPDGVLHVGWVGDSRLYVISRRLQKIRQVSKDHTEVAEKVRQNLMRHDQAVNHPRRNVLSRSVGGLPETTPEFAEGTLEATDTILICTDGLTRHLASEQILTLALQHVSSEQIAHQLVGAANQLGGKDNITALLAHVGPREAALEPLPVTLDGDTEQFPDRQPVYGTHGRRHLIEDTLPFKSNIRDRRRPLARLLIPLIPLLFIAGLVLIVASQQMSPPLALTTTDVAALATQEATVEASATPDSTQTQLYVYQVTATALIEFSTQYIPLTATSLAETFEASLTAQATDTEAASAPTEEDSSTRIAPTSTKRPTASASLLIEITVTPTASSLTPVAPLVVASDTPDAANILPTVAVIIAPLIEPYPGGICLVTLGEASVFTAVGGSAAFTLPANKVVTILQQGQPSYTVATQGVNQTYYSVKPNDGSAGSGWVKSEDLIPARNLSPEEQGAAFLLPPPTSVTQVDEPASWLPDQKLLISDSALACLPMRLKADEPTVIHVVETETPAVLIALSPVSVNGALWWNVRLDDGREGWVQQIYLTAPTP